ncbi:MAG: domain fused to wHTH, Ig, or Glycine-rich motif [Bacteroidetes bacterium]|nr:domain fused to wHTH, Ig, or Glycine-rich motif [Bacteroidota bacterium]
MAIGYVRVKRMIHTGYSPGEKYLAIIQRGGIIDFNQIASEIALVSSLGDGDVMNVLKTLEQVMVKYITNGLTVRLGLLGAFVPSIKATACDTLEEVTGATITKIRCRFNPSVWFKLRLKESKTELKSLEVKGYQIDVPVVPAP